MIRRIGLSLALFVILAGPALAQSDTSAFKTANAIKKPMQKIAALEAFLRQYPSTAFAPEAHTALFNLYLDRGNETQALASANRLLRMMDSGMRLNLYNEIAYELALKRIGLDSALVYATRAEEMAKAQGSPILSAVEDTRAFVLYRLGRASEAESLQRQALQGHETDPEYVQHLALFMEANGHRRAALDTLCRALYIGADRSLRDTLAGWLIRERPDVASRDTLKERIVMSAVRTALASTSEDKTIPARSKAAAFMGLMGVHLQTAESWARNAMASLGKNSPLEQRLSFTKNLSVVQAALGENQPALASLTSVRSFASPWDTDFWATLGNVYERLGQPAEAIEAYAQGLVASNNPQLKERLEAVYRTVHGTTDSVDADLSRLKESGAEFEPGHHPPGNPHTGKIVLAELFTGAECPPCVASDMAFDKLSEYYPTSALAILEYHVHIPGPDPLTTDDSWERFQAYKGTGTPTAVIDGIQSLVGGGSKYMTRNRFDLYRYAIDQSLAEAPSVGIALTVSGDGGTVAIRAEVSRTSSKRPQKPVLHVALVERSVDYTGGNGISRQAFVVRKLIFDPSGTSLALGQEPETVNAKVNLADVENGLKKIVDDPKNQPSWPRSKKTFNGWKSTPAGMNPSQLTVVAWVQDAASHEVLQAACQDIHWTVSEK